MTAAFGIHDHPRYPLGLKPHGKADGELLAVGWAGATPPPHEPGVDRFAHITIGLDGNDRYGDCGPTSVDNHGRVNTAYLTGTEVDATLDEVFALYRASGNPGFDPVTDTGDNGVDMATMMAAVRTVGLGGRKVTAYGRLTDTSDASIYAAIDLFGAVLFAVTLQTAQQSQSDATPAVWDYQPSAVWGGHAIVAAAYDAAAGTVDVGSWGKRIQTTAAFRAHQLDEVWVPIWPELLASAGFVAVVDKTALAADFHTLTGGTLPIPAPTPPSPPPPPFPPTPTPPAPVPPGPDLDAALWTATRMWATGSHTGGNKAAAHAVRTWAAAKGYS